MNHGVSPPRCGGVFLVKCADCKCLAVRNEDGGWKCLYDDTELPVDTEAVLAMPVELILPFLPSIKRARLCPVSIREN